MIDYACRDGEGIHSGRELITLRLHKIMPPCTMVQGGFLVGILDFLFPKRCCGCGRIGGYFCEECRGTIRFVRPDEAVCPVCQRFAVDGKTHANCSSKDTLDGLTSFFHYDRVVRGAVKTLKYRFVSDLAKEFVSLVPASLLRRVPVGRRKARVIPIPLHSSRARARGFNQAAVLGSLVAGRLHLSVRTDILYRTKHTVPQADTRSRHARLQNMANVFALREGKPAIRNRSFIVFDDVVTTGATLNEAASALKRAGARWVWGVTMAH